MQKMSEKPSFENFYFKIKTICEIPVRVCFSSLWVAELLSGVAKIFGLPSLRPSLLLDNARR